ncbi:serine hydrolase domain-containing protein [Bradyrhizobium sp. RDI18]|uniref:serine hydrolase domain-containing protein n=1 Tax=Bradyrhizobium sp. RDI18 TaxID=3367400 RepID=UPI00371808EC
MRAGLKSLIFPARLKLVGRAFAHGLPTAKPETVDVSPERLARIRAVLQKEVDAERMPGAVVMIARRGQLICSEAIGFQDKAAGKPMTEDGIFRIYSMTKPLASVGAMMLVEEGKIQLNDSVSKFLPDLANMEVIVTRDGKTTRQRAKSPITVHDLFRHTAGLTYGEFSYIPEIRAAYAEAKLLTEPSRLITPEQFIAGIAQSAARA